MSRNAAQRKPPFGQCSWSTARGPISRDSIQIAARVKAITDAAPARDAERGQAEPAQSQRAGEGDLQCRGGTSA